MKERYIPVSGKVFNHQEIDNATKVAQKGVWTLGEYGQEFEEKFSRLFGGRRVILFNSGSSANLCAFKALELKEGDEVITTAVCFPTTLNPIIESGCLPVLVDVDLATRNAIPEEIEKAITPKTKAIVLAHTLGNPFPLKEILSIARKKGLYLFEDCADALGAEYQGKWVGTFGDLATFSFYPAHHITMGEGGAVVAHDCRLVNLTQRYRDWGRDCRCEPGQDNFCGRRFGHQQGLLPYGYDHKYTYAQIGYNLKPTDFQPAIGLAQLAKLPDFLKKRQTNFDSLYDFFKQYEHLFVLPKWEKEAKPSWFGFMVVLRDDCPFSRLVICKYLEEKGIGTRPLFAGNILRQPGYLKIKHRKVGNLRNSDQITYNGFWLGVWPGIDASMMDYMKETLTKFLEAHQ